MRLVCWQKFLQSIKLDFFAIDEDKRQTINYLCINIILNQVWYY